MSFREKSAWFMGGLLLIVGVNYLAQILIAAQELGWAAPSIGIVVPFTVIIVISSIVLQSLLAASSPKEAAASPDERERPLVDRAGNWSGIVLGFGVITAALHFVYYQDGNLLFHMIVGSLILSQVAENFLLVALFRWSRR